MNLEYAAYLLNENHILNEERKVIILQNPS